MEDQISALLYVVGEQGINAKTLAQLLQTTTTDIEVSLQKIEENFSQNDNVPVLLKRFGTNYKLVTKTKYQSLIQAYSQTEQVVNLSQAALEVLAVIAYQQPVTRIEVDEVRGVKSSSSSIQTLLSRQMIATVGHKDAPGHPLMYATTDQFLDYFGLDSLDHLPDLAEFQQQNLDEQGNMDLFS